MVTTESPWDEAERTYALELDNYEHDMCTCGCGLPRATAHDPKRAFLIDKETCYAGRAIEKQKIADREAAKKANKPDGWDAGIHYFAQPMSEDEVQQFQAEQRARREEAARGRAHRRGTRQG